MKICRILRYSFAFPHISLLTLCDLFAKIRYSPLVAAKQMEGDQNALGHI